MSRRFADMARPADPPWGWKDRFYAALIAGFMVCGIAGGTLAILLFRPFH